MKSHDIQIDEYLRGQGIDMERVRAKQFVAIERMAKGRRTLSRFALVLGVGCWLVGCAYSVMSLRIYYLLHHWSVLLGFRKSLWWSTDTSLMISCFQTALVTLTIGAILLAAIYVMQRTRRKALHRLTKPRS